MCMPQSYNMTLNCVVGSLLLSNTKSKIAISVRGLHHTHEGKVYIKYAARK